MQGILTVINELHAFAIFTAFYAQHEYVIDKCI